MGNKWVYGFDELAAAERAAGGWEAVRGLLGGKGANLADMTRLGLPVPPGFTVTTAACNAYLAAGESMPEGLWEEALAALSRLESVSGKRFGDAANPLLVSCRSGARFSMPGMMDTVLNIGLNDEVAAGLERAHRRRALRLRQLPPAGADVRLGGDGDRRRAVRGGADRGPQARRGRERLRPRRRRLAAGHRPSSRRSSSARRAAPSRRTRASRSGSPPRRSSGAGTARRAVDYRNAARIAHDLGTAVNICTMVFGNLGNDSATGVAMTRSGATGAPGHRGRLPDQRPGRGRRRRRPADQADRRAAPRDAGGLRRVRGDRREARAPLSRHAGRRVHHRARQALDAADPRRQAHRPGRRAHRRRHGPGGPDHPRTGAAARLARPGRLLPASAVRKRLGKEGEARLEIGSPVG